jgi:tRNA(Ile)-lysidine synthase
MLKKFTEHIEKQFPFLKYNRFYIAVSGGIDSMVLVHLFQHFDLEFGLLHCNFKLRGDESDADMRFIHDYAEENRLHLRIGFFETEQIAKETKTSIQVTARNLRYDWFNEQMDENNVDFVATAHHADDNLETFLINLSRGTGLDGLTGIPAINDRIFRPLLPFSRDEIEQYATENNIEWREDSSNESDKYVRNKIRHHIIPLLKELNPSFLDSFQKTQAYLTDAQSLVKDAEYVVFQEVVTEKEDGTVHFNVDKLLQLPNYKGYLYQWLKQFGFTAWNDIYDLVHTQSGKQVISGDFVLLKDRDFLILYRKEIPKTNSFLIKRENNQVNIPLKLSICNVSDISVLDRNCIFVDEDQLQFPLTLRRCMVGDYFYPFGMNGKKKLISKYLKDEKISLKDKADIWVLCSENKIVWLVNHRLDERFKVMESTKSIIKITIE